MEIPSIEQFNDDSTMEKYELASEVANDVLDYIYDKIIIGKKVGELSKECDKWILNKLVGLDYKSGLAFPTCISLNNQAGYFRPSKSQDVLVKNGDLVKIELGVQVDGFPAIVGFTKLIIEEGKTLKSDDKRARVLNACAEASRGVLEVLNSEKSNFDVVKVLEIMAEKYNVNLIYGTDSQHPPGAMSFQMSKNVLDSKNDEDEKDDVHKMILNRQHESYDFTMVETFFEGNEVYMMDIAFSTGQGKIIQSTKETTIYKRNNNRKSLRLNSSKKFLSSIKSRFPICVTDSLDTPSGRIGVNDCLKNGLIEGYPVLQERHGEYIARTMFTVVIQRPNKEIDNKGHILLTGKSASIELEKIDDSNINK